jgi:hypothetical protein
MIEESLTYSNPRIVGKNAVNSLNAIMRRKSNTSETARRMIPRMLVRQLKISRAFIHILIR